MTRDLIKRSKNETFTVVAGAATFSVNTSPDLWKQWGARIHAALAAGYQAGLAQRPPPSREPLDEAVRSKIAFLESQILELEHKARSRQSIAGLKSMNRQGRSAPHAGAISADRAKAAWGGDLPGWVLALAQWCDDESQVAVSRRVGYSSSCLNQVLGRLYVGRLDRVEKAVSDALQKSGREIKT